MRAFALLALGLSLVAAPVSAQVVLDQWGTWATIATSDCADFCDPDTDVGWLLGLTFGPTNGAAGVATTDASTSGARGSAFAEATTTGGLGPTVRVDAASAAGGWVDGTATAVQGYTYTGGVADMIDVAVALTGTVGNPDGDPSTGLAAQVSYVGDANVASLVFENAVLGLVTPDGSVQLEQSADGPVALADVLSVPVQPGDQFYLIASSAATAGGAGATAESLSTLTIQFDPADAMNLQPAGVAPAVPSLNGAAAALLVVSLVVVFGIRGLRPAALAS